MLNTINQRAIRALAPVTILFTLASAVAQDAPSRSEQAEAVRRVEDIYRQSFNEAYRTTAEDVRGRQEWFRAQRSFPYDRIPDGIRQNALRQMRAMQEDLDRARSQQKGARLLAARSWEPIGPANQAGRVRGIAIDPVNAGTVYIAAAAGGVWKTTDNGTNWAPISDTLSALASGAVAIDPTNPNRVYYGTGENTNNIDRYEGDGIFRSNDGGRTWTNLGMNSVGAISKIHIRSDRPQTIYVGAAQGAGGFYRSTDNGTTWSRLVSGTVYDMAVNSSNQDQIYIAGSGFIRRSDNGGESFVSAQTGITLSGSLRISVAVAPGSPNIVYALLARSSGGGNHIGEVYRSEDYGASWTLTNTLPTNFFNQQGWYDNCIAVDPTDASTVLVGGIDVYRSGNGGVSFVNTTHSYSTGPAHPDQHIIVFDPNSPGLVYLGNDGGVCASLDGGSSWIVASEKMATSQYYAMDIDQTRPFRVYGGTQDNGSHGSYGASGFVDNWASVLGGDGFFVVVDLSDPNVIYAENFNGSPMYRINANNLSSRTRIDRPISSADDDGFWSTPIAMNPFDRVSLYSGRTGLWRSTDQGSTWEMLSPGNSAGATGKITAIGASPVAAGRIAVGTYGQGAFYTTDDGATWARCGGLPNRFVTDVRYDPVLATRLYVTVSGSGSAHVYVSNNGGETFTSVSSNLPDIPTNSVEIDPQNNGHLFVGTDIGVFVSLDTGAHWFPYNVGLALSPVVSVKIHRSSRMLVAATHGRSMFRISIDNIEPAATLLAPVGGESFVTPLDLDVSWLGVSQPADVLLSYDGGATWNTMATGVVRSSASIPVPLVRTSMARVRVQTAGGGVRLESANFSLTATANTSALPRAFKAEAIAVRGREMWATSATSDSIYRLNLPLLTGLRGFNRAGISGRVRSLAYDKGRDVFYALTGDADFSNARLMMVDTTGREFHEIPLPAASVMAVSDDPEGVAVVTAQAPNTVYVLDTVGTVLHEYGPLTNGANDYRRGLQWDEFGYVQGTTRLDDGPFFVSELQQVTRGNPFRVREATPVIPQSSQGLYWVDLAIDLSDTNADNNTIWATDSAGAFYRFTRGSFFTTGVDGSPPTFHAAGLDIASVTPNPTHGNGSAVVRLSSRAEVQATLVESTGRHVAQIFKGLLDGGAHTLPLLLDAVPSGLYYLSIETADGRRDVAPVVVVQ